MIFNPRERRFRNAVGDAVFKVTSRSRTWSTRVHVEGKISVYDGSDVYIGLFAPEQSQRILKYVIGRGMPDDSVFEVVLGYILSLRARGRDGDVRYERITNELGLKLTDQLGTRLDELAAKRHQD